MSTPVSRYGASGKKDNVPADLLLKTKADLLQQINLLLQRGFALQVQVGYSIRSLLTDQLGISPEYVSCSLSTILLNGKPVDDLDKAVIQDGDTLALSSAMPGLVGAVMRRGGALACFRGSISYTGSVGCVTPSEGRIRLKLFNLVIRDLGTLFLEKGVIVQKSDIEEWVTNRSDQLIRLNVEVLLDGVPLDPALLLRNGIRSGGEEICLRVAIATGQADPKGGD